MLCPNPDYYPKALRLLYEYWSSFSDKEKQSFQQIEGYDLLEKVLRIERGETKHKVLQDLDEWENEKLVQWKKEGRLSPNGKLISHKSSEDFLRDF